MYCVIHKTVKRFHFRKNVKTDSVQKRILIKSHEYLQTLGK